MKSLLPKAPDAKPRSADQHLAISAPGKYLGVIASWLPPSITAGALLLIGGLALAWAVCWTIDRWLVPLTNPGWFFLPVVALKRTPLAAHCPDRTRPDRRGLCRLHAPPGGWQQRAVSSGRCRWPDAPARSHLSPHAARRGRCAGADLSGAAPGAGGRCDERRARPWAAARPLAPPWRSC